MSPSLPQPFEQEGVGDRLQRTRTVSKEAESSSIAQANRGCVTVTRIAARTPSAGSQYTSRVHPVQGGRGVKIVISWLCNVK